MDSVLADSGQTDSGLKDADRGNAAYRNMDKRNEIVLYVPNTTQGWSC